MYVYLHSDKNLFSFDRCLCGNCSTMPTEQENVCCLEIAQVVSTYSKRKLVCLDYGLFHTYIMRHSGIYCLQYLAGYQTAAGGWGEPEMHGGPSWIGACMPQCILAPECMSNLQGGLWSFAAERNSPVRYVFSKCYNLYWNQMCFVFLLCFTGHNHITVIKCDKQDSFSRHFLNIYWHWIIATNKL